MPKLFQISVPAIAAVLWLSVSPALGSFTSYGSYMGTLMGQVDFLDVTENAFTSPTPLFNMPTRVANRLVFNNPTFASTSSAATPHQHTSTIKTHIAADLGKFIELIIFRERGSFQFTGQGTDATTSQVSGQLTVIDLTHFPGPQYIVPLVVTPQPIYTLTTHGPSGTFSGYAAIDLTGLGITEALVSFSNNLQTSSEEGTTSEIRKHKVRLETPEPASSLLLLAAATLIVGRRRRYANP